ncbi:hypothetical protein [Nonomuraea diastatica]|uniref:Uncharacterized protein n=1 Tax=Nonomuraea diastatica TaxID=1848329 RepID=A0A4R4WPS0_9ACTN|nr:hypothetical protein [Nonomuraea diastatica]TDD16390.1 hypothetical protein E1294_31430 [Nonomuraea diastatica]
MSRKAPSSSPTAPAASQKPVAPSTMLTPSSGRTRFADATISHGNGADPGLAAGGNDTSGDGTFPAVAATCGAPSGVACANPSGNSCADPWGIDCVDPWDRVEP